MNRFLDRLRGFFTRAGSNASKQRYPSRATIHFRRTQEVEALLKKMRTAYQGKGKCSIHIEKLKRGPARLQEIYAVHFIITENPFKKLSTRAMLESRCSFSITVSEQDYGLYRVWYDDAEENWRSLLLSTRDFKELQTKLKEEWDKGKAGAFFH